MLFSQKNTFTSKNRHVTPHVTLCVCIFLSKIVHVTYVTLLFFKYIYIYNIYIYKQHTYICIYNKKITCPISLESTFKKDGRAVTCPVTGVACYLVSSSVSKHLETALISSNKKDIEK